MKTALVILGVILFPIVIVATCRAAVSNQFIASGVYTLTIAAMLVCIMTAFTATGRVRSVMTGCAVFAIGYFMLAVLIVDAWEPAAELLRLPDAPPQLYFSTTYCLAWAYDEVSDHYMELWTSGGTRAPAWHLMTKAVGRVPRDMDLSTLHTFLRAGHCLFIWLIGAGGAVVGNWMWKQNQADLHRGGS